MTREALSIPRSALLTRGIQKGVYLLTEDMVTVFQPIEIGQIKGDAVEVVDGLEKGVEIVAVGAQKLERRRPGKDTMNLPELAIRRPVFITVVFLIVTLLGAISFMQLPVDLMPDVSFPTLTVQVGYAGVGPEEMEELVSIPLERALALYAGLRGNHFHILGGK